jgi:hypothetical protein
MCLLLYMYKYIIYIHILIDGASILDLALGPKKSGTALPPHHVPGGSNCCCKLRRQETRFGAAAPPRAPPAARTTPPAARRVTPSGRLPCPDPRLLQEQEQPGHRRGATPLPGEATGSGEAKMILILVHSPLQIRKLV